MNSSKKEVLFSLLHKPQGALVHFDSRKLGVIVPDHLADKPQVVLQLGFCFPVPIPDLELTDDGWSATLSFRRKPYRCVVPWDAVYAIVGDGTKAVWADDVPQELRETQGNVRAS